MNDPAATLSIALRSRYCIERELGHGGMGIVYLAEDLRHHRRVAIKVLDPELGVAVAAARFLREISVAAQLNHPNIVPLHDSGEADGLLYYIMPFVEGESLRHRLERSPRLPLQEAVRITSQVAEGLAYAHSKGLIHRDIKPENILLQADHAMIGDFGIARAADTSADAARVTATGLAIGTPAYMSPEQASGSTDIGPPTDIYSLGCMLYEMLGGAPPFAGTNQKILARKLTEPPPRISRVRDVSPDIEEVLLKALAPSPADRFADVSEFNVALQSAAGSVRESARASRTSTVVKTTAEAARAAIRSLAVLPFENLSNDAEQEYFVAGMHDAILGELGQIGALRVISRTSAMRYKNSDKTLTQIARELKVDGLVEGSVFRTGNKVRIHVRLIRAMPEEANVWSGAYDREVSDLPALHGDVAEAIAREIRIRVTTQEESRLAAAPKVEPRAYEAYLKGRFHSYQWTPDSLETARKFFELALEKDPDCALAHAGLAHYWGIQGVMGLIRPRDALSEGRAAAVKALQLDESLAEAHDLRGRIALYYEWDWATAEREFLRALELKPGCADAHCFYSDLLSLSKRAEEGERHLNQALDLDPFNVFFQNLRGWALNDARRYEEAIAQLESVLRAAPMLPQATFALWGSATHSGDYQKAIDAASRYFAGVGDQDSVNALAGGANESYQTAMRRAAAVLSRRSAAAYVQPTVVARLFLYAKENEAALEWLEKGFEMGDPFMLRLAVNPDCDALRGHLRFQQIFRRMKFPETAALP